MKLVVGLGNPGAGYRHTRHNVGFSVVAELAQRHRIGARARAGALVGQGDIAGRAVVLAQPSTMMNLSGRAVALLRRAHRVRDLADLLIILDDLDIPLGTMRVRERGGSGGHNGMKSIIESLGSQEFARLRIGIGRPPPGEDPVDYVLSGFRSNEKPIVEQVIRLAADAVECWIEHGSAETMNRFNREPAANG